MPRPSRDQLALFMSDVLVWLGQPRWQIVLLEEDEEGDDEVWAITRYAASSQRFVVQLWISDHVLNESSSDEQRVIMTHEALHSIHVGIDRVLWSDYVIGMMRPAEHSTLCNDMYHRERELMVDQLSYSIANTAEIKKLWRERCAPAKVE